MLAVALAVGTLATRPMDSRLRGWGVADASPSRCLQMNGKILFVNLMPFLEKNTSLFCKVCAWRRHADGPKFAVPYPCASMQNTHAAQHQALAAACMHTGVGVGAIVWGPGFSTPAPPGVAWLRAPT